jgi:hypothetical protein
MPEFTDLSQLEKYINEKINSALRNEVADTARDTMQEHVMSDVYDKYTPTQYVRTGDLYKDIVTQMVDDNTVSIENVTRDEETGRLVAPVVESGQGYTWKDSRIYNMQPFPRPFVENTAKDLADGKAKIALAQGLKRQGLDIV